MTAAPGGASRKRVVLMLDHFGSENAGTENQLGKIIRGLAPRFDIDLISFRDCEWLRNVDFPCRKHIFQINNFARLYTYRNLFRLIRHLRASRPHVVHTFFPVANILGVLCARLAGIRAIAASRRDYGEWMSTRYYYATRIANRFVAGIVANSHEVKRLTERVEKFPAARIEVIYNGIAPEAFSDKTGGTSMKRALGIPAGNKVVGLVANFRPMKRHQTFIDAAERIIRRRDDVSFLLLGKNAVPGDPRRKVEDLVAARGLAHRIYFSHAMGNMHEFLSMMDIGVNCSEGEGLSNAIMEYMAARVPCVVSASGGNPDLITDNVHGYTFALGDDEALARQICRLLDDEAARRRLTENAYAKVHGEMSIEAMLDNFARYYTALAAGGTKSEGELRKAAETEIR